MRGRLLRAVALSLMFVSALASGAYAQSQSGSINGTVVDSQGGVLPGADIAAKSNATGGEFRAVTNTEGQFTIPALNAGVYTVTVTATDAFGSSGSTTFVVRVPRECRTC